MAIDKVTRWKTSDGKEFKTKSEAIKHHFRNKFECLCCKGKGSLETRENYNPYELTTFHNYKPTRYGATICETCQGVGYTDVEYEEVTQTIVTGWRPKSDSD